jgi:hypothetical protein
MGFFDDVPPGLERPGRGGAWDLPEAEFPRVAVADALVLARTQEVAVAVTVIWAFRAGFEFWVRAQFRHPGPALADQADDQSLHIGVQFADGRKVANVEGVPRAAGSVPGGLILRPLGFGGGLRHRGRSYWVSPLPPAGPVTFACEWAAFGIGEKRAEADAQLILDAAARSVRLWPEDNG